MPTDLSESCVSQSIASPEGPWTENFRRLGYVHFRQLLPASRVEAARKKILQSVEKHFDPARLVEYNNRSWCPELRNAGEIKRLFENKEVQGITDQVLGKKRYGWSSGQIAIRQAHSAELPVEPLAHIDGIPTPTNGMEGSEIQNFTALFGIFLTEVKSEFAGNFTVWPGSHLLIERYFQEHGEAALTQGMPIVALGEAVQLLCQPGDVVLCHYQLAHTAAVNTSDRDRIAVFFRLCFNDMSGPEHRSQRWHNLTHMWHGWRI